MANKYTLIISGYKKEYEDPKVTFLISHDLNNILW